MESKLQFRENHLTHESPFYIPAGHIPVAGGTKLSSPATIFLSNYLIINNALCPMNFSKPNQPFSRRPIRCFSKPKFCSIDGVLYSKDMKSLQMCPMSYEGEFKVPDGVEYTSSRAFFPVPVLRKLSFPTAYGI